MRAELFLLVAIAFCLGAIVSTLWSIMCELFPLYDDECGGQEDKCPCEIDKSFVHLFSACRRDAVKQRYFRGKNCGFYCPVCVFLKSRLFCYVIGFFAKAVNFFTQFVFIHASIFGRRRPEQQAITNPPQNCNESAVDKPVRKV